MRIDAHQHFWTYDPARHSWISEEMTGIRKDFMPGDLLPILEHHSVDGTVLVQVDQTEDENAFLLELASRFPFIRGVVGWVDLFSEDLEPALDRWSDHQLMKGFRYITQGRPKGFLTESRLIDGISKLEGYGLSYDILIYENQLEEAVTMVSRLPVMKLVVDHIAKPEIRNNSFDQWKRGMTKMAQFEHVYVKLSGMVTEAVWSSWTEDQLIPYMDSVLELFGPSRVLFGSDWPVCLLAGKYERVIGVIDKFVSKLNEDEQQAIMGKNAVEFYQLE